MSDVIASPAETLPTPWREALDAVSAYVLVAEEEGRLVYANHAAAQTLPVAPGRPVEEVTAEVDVAWSRARAEHEGRRYEVYTGTPGEDLRFRQILETAPGGLAIGTATRITWANRALAAMHGYTRDEILRLQLIVLFVPEEREQASAILRALGTGRRSWDARLLRKDGSRFAARIDAWGAGTGLYSLAWVEDTGDTSVTKAQRLVAEAGKLLTESLEVRAILDRLAELYARLLADVAIVDLRTEDGGIRRAAVRSRDSDRQWIADALQHVPVDRSRPHLVGEVLSSWGPALLSEVSEQHLKAWSQTPAYEAILRALRPRALLGIPLLARGEILGAITLVRTARMNRFTGSELRLADAIASWAAFAVSNARLYEATRRAVEQRDELLRMVAHDLEGPVSACALGAQHLARELPSELRHAHRVLASIRASALRGSRLVDDLLAHGLDVAPAPHPLARLLEQAARSLGPLVEDAHLSLVVDVTPELPPVLVDRDRMLQVLGNLVDNAVKHTSPGGTVTLRARRQRGHVVIAVTDTGHGDPGRGGAGLGLAVAKRLVEAHGGRIWMDSDLGRGTTVSFTVRVAP